MAPIAPARVIDVLAQVFKAHIVGLQDTSGIEGNGSDVVGVNDADDEVTGVVLMLACMSEVLAASVPV
jgi:hypothetical protein